MLRHRAVAATPVCVAHPFRPFAPYLMRPTCCTARLHTVAPIVRVAMKRIFIPTTNADDWRRFLAEPEKQWRTGFSARALAHCWEQANGFPAEITDVFSQSGPPPFRKIELLLAFPEYQVPLPGGRRPSQSDLLVVAKDGDGELVVIAVEGKVAEPFGPTVAQWNSPGSTGRRERLGYLQQLLGLSDELPNEIRYQLLHRTASALIEACRFNARSAVMLVHSFSQDAPWFDDFQAFLGLFGVQSQPNQLQWLRDLQGIDLYAGWVKGNEEFL